MIKKLKLIIPMIAILILIIANNSYAQNETKLTKPDYRQEYLDYLENPDDYELMPAPIEIKMVKKSNLFARLKDSSSKSSSFNLKDVIANNVVIKNQMSQGTCNQFAALKVVETTLAMQDKKNLISEKLYDFSERHMAYGESQTFLNSEYNPYGTGKQVNDGGIWLTAIKYLTSGIGPVDESEMPYEDNSNPISLSSLLSCTPKAQVLDSVALPTLSNYTGTDEQKEILNVIKSHIQEYGAVYAMIDSECITEDGTLCCPGTTGHGTNHAVAIVGWDDNYQASNFGEDSSNASVPGAWIIANSWGDKEVYTMEQLKQILVDASDSYSSTSEISDSLVQYIVNQTPSMSFDGDGNIVNVLPNDGFVYVSYCDAFVTTNIYGLTNILNYKDFENRYTYNEAPVVSVLSFPYPQAKLASSFNKKTSGDEYISYIGVHISNTQIISGYISTNSNEKDTTKMQRISFEDGYTLTLDPGYHALKLKTPIKVSDNFTIVLNTLSYDGGNVLVDGSFYDSKISYCKTEVMEQNKCYLTSDILKEDGKEVWLETSSEAYEIVGTNFDLGISVLTTSNPDIKKVTNIEILALPKTSYYVGEDFIPNGMTVKVTYNDGTNEELTDTSIEFSNTTNLHETQTNINAKYMDFEFLVPITVKQDRKVSLELIEFPRTSYVEGEDFDDSNMHLAVVYESGKKVQVVDYTIENGTNLTKDQDCVIVKYDGLELEVSIYVTQVPIVATLTSIAITKNPKTIYEEGQNFDPTGMEVTAYYSDGTSEVVTNYQINGGNNLTIDTQYVIITYQTKQVQLEITVNSISNEATLTSIEITQNPKTTYIEGQNFDPTGMEVTAYYSDGTNKVVTDYIVSGGTNLTTSTTYVTITYETKQVRLNITVDPKPEATLTKIEITKLPTKLNYEENEYFNPVGMVVTAYYSDGTQNDVTSYTYQTTKLTKDQTSVVITYEGKTASVSITVNPKEVIPQKLEISKMPNKTSYLTGEDFVKTGMIILLVYSDGTKTQITDYTVENGNNLRDGQTSVQITSNGLSIEVPITVTRKPLVNTDFSDAKIHLQLLDVDFSSDYDEIEDIKTYITVYNINRNTRTTYEYYYYMSDKDNETNIQDWSKISKTQKDATKIAFESNISDFPNNKQTLLNANDIYIYIKEVAIDGSTTQEVISKAIEPTASIKSYEEDIADKSTVVIPYAGLKNVFVFVCIGFSVLAFVLFIRYKIADNMSK